VTLVLSAIAFGATLALIASLGRAVRQLLARGSRPRGLGTSLLTGVAAIALIGGAVAFAGLPPVPFALAAALVSAPFALRGRRRRPAFDCRSGAFALPVALALMVLLGLCRGPMPGAYDALADWVYKARDVTGLDFHPPPWRGPFGAQHPEYPPGLSVLDALVLACTRSYPWLWLRAFQVTMLAALVGTTWQSLDGLRRMRSRGVVRAFLLGCCCAVVLLLPRVRANLVLANADLPVAVLAAAGVLLLARSPLASSTRRAPAIEGLLLLCGAAAMKQEGAVVLVASLALLGWILGRGLLALMGRGGLVLLGVAACPYVVNLLSGTRNSDYSADQPIATIAHKFAAGAEVIVGDLAVDAALIGGVAIAAAALVRRGSPRLRRSVALPMAVVACELTVVAIGYAFARGGAESLAQHSFNRVLLTPVLVMLFVAVPLALAGDGDAGT
jgi:hypothetical protein